MIGFPLGFPFNQETVFSRFSRKSAKDPGCSMVFCRPLTKENIEPPILWMVSRNPEIAPPNSETQGNDKRFPHVSTIASVLGFLPMDSLSRCDFWISQQSTTPGMINDSPTSWFPSHMSLFAGARLDADISSPSSRGTTRPWRGRRIWSRSSSRRGRTSGPRTASGRPRCRRTRRIARSARIERSRREKPKDGNARKLGLGYVMGMVKTKSTSQHETKP